jgi:hypothetical protein
MRRPDERGAGVFNVAQVIVACGALTLLSGQADSG